MSATADLTVTLPNGLCVDGVRHRQAVLRPFTGRDEVALLEESTFRSRAQQTTALLARCVVRLGSLTPVSVETVRALTLGDREALLLHLRRLTLGERLECVLKCTHPGCGEEMDLELGVSQLLLTPYEQVQDWHEATLRDQAKTYAVQYRVPRGDDQEAAADATPADARRSVAVLLERCVRVPQGGHIEPWTEPLIDQLAAQMLERDPQAELTLRLECAACSQPLRVLFDSASFLFREVALRGRDLYREVHVLALHYHWGETEIMNMTASTRHRYLSLLTEHLSGGQR